MELKLAKCARCEKLFNKIYSEVCDLCQPDEDQDFTRIHDVISRRRGLNAQEVAEEAEVALDCVLRMQREGRINRIEQDEAATCGRCGASAISATKRLCQRCLVMLDRECAQAMIEMRQRIRAKHESDMNDVQTAVLKKRASKKERRELETAANVKSDPGKGMAITGRLGRKKS